MSLVDDAKRVVERAVTYHEIEGKRATVCHLCSWARISWGDRPVEHSPKCPVPGLPRIVAALEAAERMVAAFEADEQEAFWREFDALAADEESA